MSEVGPTASAWTPVTNAEPVLFFRPASIDDLDAVYALEVASYPEDEAATREKLDFRIQHAGNAFLVAQQGDTIVGFTCGTCSTASQLTHASMSTHEADGSLLCIHSVVVDPKLRRQGIATRMLKAYLAYVQASTPHLQHVRLLCKDNLKPLYAGVGFQLIGLSEVVHGQDPWYEMGWAPGDNQ